MPTAAGLTRSTSRQTGCASCLARMTARSGSGILVEAARTDTCRDGQRTPHHSLPTTTASSPSPPLHPAHRIPTTASPPLPVTLQRLSEKGKAHSQAICSVVFSPDGTKIASGAYDRTIRVWDAVTLELQSEKQGAHRKHIRSVDFSPDGTRMVSGADDRAIRVWESGASMPPPFPTPRPPRAVPTPQSSSSVQCVGPANTATLELAAEATDAHIEIGGESINAVQFSPDGANIVSAGVDDTIKIWDFSPGGRLSLAEERTDNSVECSKVTDGDGAESLGQRASWYAPGKLCCVATL
mmetsp:Transcript_12793/g.29184  ORF Transcript_12793/g.29184 Transcript_12793/m.29184 type:complete len:297 (+) Transcript_12793:645-1535(+)